MEYILVYKGRNWPSDVDGPNVALTVVRHGEYFQFYIALFPSAGALDLVAAPCPHPHGVGDRWYQALTSAAIEEIERDIREGHQPDPDESKRINARCTRCTRCIRPNPAHVRALERENHLLPEIRDRLFAGIEVARIQV